MTPAPPPVSESLAFCAASPWPDGEAGERETEGGVSEARGGGDREQGPSLAPWPGPWQVHQVERSRGELTGKVEGRPGKWTLNSGHW